jgi:hypothetical protein
MHAHRHPLAGAVVMAVALGLGLALALAACKRDAATTTTTTTTAASSSSSVQAVTPAVPATASIASALPAPAPAPPDPVGEATLVIQRVESDCGEGPKGRHFLGFDVLVASKLDGTKKDPPARPISCPPGQRNTWQMCKMYSRCTVDDDAGADRIVVTCDKDTITLESSPAGTRVTAPGGVAVDLAPGPMRLAPVKKTQRLALVDC